MYYRKILREFHTAHTRGGGILESTISYTNIMGSIQEEIELFELYRKKLT
jgi:hypothetical protein